MVHAQCVVCYRSATDFKTVSIWHSKQLLSAKFFGSFYIKTTKCYNLDAYQAKKCKQKNVDLTVHTPDYRKYLSPEILYIPYK